MKNHHRTKIGIEPGHTVTTYYLPPPGQYRLRKFWEI